MNRFKGLRCYLAGNIEAITDHEARDWRIKARVELEKRGFEVFDPLAKPVWLGANENVSERQELSQLRKQGRWEEFAIRAAEIRRVDLRAVNHADLVIACLAPDKLAVGTIEEIVTATREGKLVFVVMDKDPVEMNPWLLDMVGLKYIHRTLKEVYTCLDAFTPIEMYVSPD